MSPPRGPGLVAIVIVSALVSLTAARFFGSSRDTTPPGKSASTYATIRSKGSIRAAYSVGAPIFMIDPATKQKSGIFFEITNSAAAKLGLKVDWTEEVGYGEMIQGLNTHRYDVVASGVWINSARGALADFSIPAYYEVVLAYVKVGDTRFDGNLPVLNAPEYTISTMDGELGAEIAKAEFPRAKTIDLPQNADWSQLILNVINGKADVVFLGFAPARAYQAANPDKISAVKGAKPLRVFPVAIVLPKGTYELKQSLDYALEEMLRNGEIDSILHKYESAPGSFIRPSVPYQLPQP